MANPIRYSDLSGHIYEDEAKEASDIYTELNKYQVHIFMDWGYYKNGDYLGLVYPDPQMMVDLYGYGTCAEWEKGKWELAQLKAILAGFVIMHNGIQRLGGDPNAVLGVVDFEKIYGRSFAGFDNKVRYGNSQVKTVIHEMGHISMLKNPETLEYFMDEVGASCLYNYWWGFGSSEWCNEDQNQNTIYNGGTYEGDEWKYTRPIAQPQPANTHMPSDYAGVGNWEDYAETFTIVLAEAYLMSSNKQYKVEAQAVYSAYNSDISRRRKVMKAIISGSWR